MKKAVLLIFLSFLLSQVYPQRDYLRVYNAKGKMISRGRLFQTTDSSIILQRALNYFESPVPEIDVIKSKRTTTRRIVITTLSVVGVVFFIAASVKAKNQSPDNSGALLPTRSRRNYNNETPSNESERPFKKYEVYGDNNKWQTQRRLLNRLL